MSCSAYPLFISAEQVIALNAKQSLLENIQNGTFALHTADEIARKIKVGRREALALRDMLSSLVRTGELLTDDRGRFGTAEQFGAKKGTVSANERGFGFFVPEDGTRDLFIPHRLMKGALHGDVVLAVCTGGRLGDEGEVLAIVSHGIKQLVGTYRRDHRAGYLSPDDKKYGAEIFIPAGKHKGCPDGCKAVAKITSFEGRLPAGEIIEVLGKSGDFFTEELALIRAHDLCETFPTDIEAEAERQARRPIGDLKGRKDLREELIITVDGEDTRDIDDAISVKKRGDLYELGVHIADVSNYVARNSPLDREAFKRGTSVYFPDRVLPMLPTALSNGICSLNEGVDRLTLSCLMTVDGAGKVLKKKIVPSVIRSRHRMTYTKIMEIYERNGSVAEAYPDLVAFVDTAMELTNILKAARERRGGVALDVKEAKIVYENGRISIPDAGRTLAHEMIECFMVLANESVADIMTEMDAPFIYRVHERPSEEKATDFSTFLKELGIPVKFRAESVSPRDYQALLKGLAQSPLYPLVNRVMLRSMMKAQYSPQNIGHFGLASERYCHFTSPIRRYPDLCIHRIIKDMLADPARAQAQYKDFVRDAAVRSSACERNAQDAERDVDDLYIVGYMQDKIGQEYDATISGVTGFGLFAELANTVEGFIPLETLPDDSYEFYESRFVLRGTKNVYHLGGSVRVKVAGVDWGARRVQFALLESKR